MWDINRKLFAIIPLLIFGGTIGCLLAGAK
jgi:hypothetical protein